MWHDKDPSLLVVHKPKSCCSSCPYGRNIFSSETLNNRQTKLYILYSCFTSRSCLGEEGLQLLIKVQSLYPGKTHNTSLFYFIWGNNRLNIKSKPSIDLFWWSRHVETAVLILQSWRGIAVTWRQMCFTNRSNSFERRSYVWLTDFSYSNCILQYHIYFPHEQLCLTNKL